MFGVSNVQVYGIGNSVNSASTHQQPKQSFVERIKENVLHNRDTMKWTNSMSSLTGSIINGTTTTNSGNGDRRSTFYTDQDLIVNENEKIQESNEMLDLRQKLRTSEENLEIQMKKCENLIVYFTNQINDLTEELEVEKTWRAEQLAKIVKALLCFEAKLREEQKVIRKQLYERDTVINRLSTEISVLRKRCNSSDEADFNLGDSTQYCSKCRKHYHLMEYRNVSVQVDCLPNDTDLEYLSSSETGIPAFSEARRSKKYMSKRTSGTFKDYLRSRLTNSNSDDNPQNSNDSQESSDDVCTISSTNNTETIENNSKAEDVNDKDDKSEKSSDHSKPFRRRSIRRSYSSIINNLHGIRPNGILNQLDSDNVNTSTDNDDEVFQKKSKAMTILKKYNTDDLSSKIQFESTDDWYASASDMDDSDSHISKSYGYNAVNPVLECVNQILLQQSMDGLMDSGSSSQESPETTLPSSQKSTTTANTQQRQKRVHFSTQNSMVQVPRTMDSTFESRDFSPEILSNPPNSQSLNYESVYSNAYEHIGSENNSSSHYIDMESKSGNENDSRVLNVCEKPLKIPPALPPKPANLMKFRHIIRIPVTVNSLISDSGSLKSVRNIDTESEPDYCSISEVNEIVQQNADIETIVEIHKSGDEMSVKSEDTKTDVTDESFIDVPKLPNVTAILSPKKDKVQLNKFITQDNYITKSPVKPALPNNNNFNTVSTVLHEINLRKNDQIGGKSQNIPKNGNLKQNTITVIKPKTQQAICVDVDNAPIQAEFDWYNLDAEYGPIGEPIKACSTLNGKQKIKILNNNQVNGSDGSCNGDENVSIEYNLDEEFDMAPNPSTIDEMAVIGNENTKNISNIKANLKFATLNNDTPRKPFNTFLDDTGLTSKPLPRKRKIFYTAPFV